MAHRCPKCNAVIEVGVRLTAAPPMQSDTAKPAPTNGGGDLGELLELIDDNTLSGKAVDFVAQTRARFAQYGDRTRMSDPQIKWLKALAGGGDGDEW